MALALLVSFQEQEQKSDYELALLVSFQEQEQKSDYELAKARIFLRAKALDSPCCE